MFKFFTNDLKHLRLSIYIKDFVSLPCIWFCLYKDKYFPVLYELAIRDFQLSFEIFAVV